MEYGCIGEKLGHSFSKEIHNALGDYDYELVELTPEELPDFMEKADFKAINVTIPYKRDVMKYLHYISPQAEAINAVNTIVNKDGKLYGYNTDFFGMKAMIERSGISLEGKKVCILGSGGTSNTAFAVAVFMGASLVLKVSRTSRKNYITYDELYEKFSDCNIIINTTPCGMYPNSGVSPVDISKFPCCEAVFDAVYNPLCSKLVLDAKEKNIFATGGLYMLVSQAAYAVEHFMDKKVDASQVEEIYQRLLKNKMNIVLTGMPSCGKSSVGRALSEVLNKTFSDTDESIISSVGKSITEIFSEEGEETFRDIESKMISIVSSNNSFVIATGGGAVLRDVNVQSLKSNGRVYFIDRPFECLVATDDRPLSSDIDSLRKRYEERYDIYRSTADVIIDGSGTVEDVVKRIEAEFNEYSCN